MGVADPDRRWPGLYDDRPQIRRNTLFLNRGDGSYSEIANFAGAEASDWTWCIAFMDVDLDGYEDLLMAERSRLRHSGPDAMERIQSRPPRSAQEARNDLRSSRPCTLPTMLFAIGRPDLRGNRRGLGV